ncbi:MAG: UDP-N-acetylmuramate--L-alanine ligase [Gemmatimonadota bacterium]
MSGPERLAPASRSDLPSAGGRIHLVGIAGAGMRSLAALLSAAGYRVSGCDRGEAGDLPEMSDLDALSIRRAAGHSPEHVRGMDLIVRSAAVPENAPELEAARGVGVPVILRARALGALLNPRRLAGIAGTHGKTTITAMAGLACEAGGLDPTVSVGGRVEEWAGFARAGSGPAAVAEADEFDRSFLRLDPWLAVVSSLEPEHLETYGGEEELRAAFAEFAGRAVERGGVLVCADDPGARALARELRGRALTYGFAPEADYRVETLPEAGGRAAFRLHAPDGAHEFELRVPGRHNARNAAAALAVALRLGADPRAAAGSLGRFGGVARRLQVLAETGGLRVVDDYAHHPTEVRASLSALRAGRPDERLVAVFQPHLFSRTRRFAAEFAAALGGADEALVLPIYPSREEPIPGVTSERIEAAARASGAGGVRSGAGSGAGGVRCASGPEALERVREAIAAAPGPSAGPDGSVRAVSPVTFVFMGAGDVTALAHRAAELVNDVLGA